MNGDMFAGNDTLCINVTYQPSVGFSEVDDRSASWNIFPNPANDHTFVLGLNEQTLPLEWEIWDAVGRKHAVEMTFESESRARLNVSGLPPGFYHLLPVPLAHGSESTLHKPLPLLIRR